MEEGDLVMRMRGFMLLRCSQLRAWPSYHRWPWRNHWPIRATPPARRSCRQQARRTRNWLWRPPYFPDATRAIMGAAHFSRWLVNLDTLACTSKKVQTIQTPSLRIGLILITYRNSSKLWRRTPKKGCRRPPRARKFARLHLQYSLYYSWA